LSYIMDSEMPMAFRELYPIVVATVLWNKYWSRKRYAIPLFEKNMPHVKVFSAFRRQWNIQIEIINFSR
jgi:hypothetical protein